MTIEQAITRAKRLKPNTFSDGEMVEWLSHCDRVLVKNILETHPGAETAAFHGYTEADRDKELIAPPPYDAVYPYWIMARVDLANAEYDQYNASITLFNGEYQAFEAWYHRNHTPASAGNRFLF